MDMQCIGTLGSTISLSLRPSTGEKGWTLFGLATRKKFYVLNLRTSGGRVNKFLNRIFRLEAADTNLGLNSVELGKSRRVIRALSFIQIPHD